MTVTVPAAPPTTYRVDARDIDQPDIAVPTGPAGRFAIDTGTDAGQVRVRSG